jgi:hypothetical protein
MQLQKKTSGILHLDSSGVLTLIFIYGFVCLAVIRMLVPITSSGDNSFFMPLSFMYIETGELTNPWRNPIGSNSFNWHGFIHPLAVAAVSMGKGWHGVNSGIIVLGVAALSLFVILGYLSRVYLPFMLPAVIVVISMIISFSGRPETTVAILCMLLYYAGYASLLYSDPLRRRITWALSGALIGTLAAANPGALPVVVLAQTCFILAIYGVQDNNLKRLYISLTVIFGTAIVSFLLLLIVVYPLPAGEWIDGVIEHARTKTFNGEGFGANAGAKAADYVKSLLLSKDAPLIMLYGWFVIPVAWALYYRIILNRDNKVLVYFTIGAFVLTTMLVLRGLTSVFARYNFVVFVPTILLIVGLLFTKDRNAKHNAVTLSLLYVLATVALLTQFIWIYQNIRSWSNAQVYNNRLDHIVSTAIDAGLNVGVNSAILTAVDNPDQLKKLRVIRYDSEADPTKFDLVILSQNEHPSERPIQLRNFELIEVDYDPCCSLLFPRPLNNAFATYRSLDRTAFRPDE